MSEKPGVRCIKVSLEKSNGRIVYNPALTNTEQLCAQINAISNKFTATPTTSDTNTTTQQGRVCRSLYANYTAAMSISKKSTDSILTTQD